MNVIVYGTGCPQCNVLTSKLIQRGICFVENSNEDDIKKIAEDNHIMSMPILAVDDTVMSFPKAIKWINNFEG